MKNSKDEIILEGIQSKGYGIIYKSVMSDRRLSRDARLIYAYFCSYAGTGNSVFPSVNKIRYDLNFGSEDTFYHHFNYLKAYGYVIVKHRHDEKGKVISNTYILPINPIENLEYLKKIEERTANVRKQNAKAKKDIPLIIRDTPNYSSTDNSSTDNWGTINNRFKNNNFNNNRKKPTHENFNQRPVEELDEDKYYVDTTKE